MRREHGTKTTEPIPFWSDCIFYVPLIDDGIDLKSGLTPSSGGSVTFNNGAVFANGHLAYTMSRDFALSAKTLVCDLSPSTQINSYNYAYHFGISLNMVNYYRAGIALTSTNYLWWTISYSSNRYDKDENLQYNVPSGAFKKVVIVFESSAQKIYVDGTLIKTNNNTDNFNNWSNSNIILNLGNVIPNSSTRAFYGTIKNYAIYNRALSASEVAQL